MATTSASPTTCFSDGVATQTAAITGSVAAGCAASLTVGIAALSERRRLPT